MSEAINVFKTSMFTLIMMRILHMTEFYTTTKNKQRNHTILHIIKKFLYIKLQNVNKYHAINLFCCLYVLILNILQLSILTLNRHSTLNGVDSALFQKNHGAELLQ